MQFDKHFIKERTGHLEKISNMDQDFFLSSFKWVNCKHRSRIYCTTHECNLFADDPGKLQLFCLRASLYNFPIYGSNY
jgi:hypothetical protein